MEPIIEVKNLTKYFETTIKQAGVFGALKGMLRPKKKLVRAVDNVTLRINEGELVGFIGPNGAGKSTTIKMLTGILHPTSGSIRVLGHDPQHERIPLAYKIGTIFGQRQQLWYHLPAIDTFNLFSKIYDMNKEDYQKRLQKLITLFSIKPFLQKPVRNLSLGERMRCEFVASLLHHPKVLFLDEPTIGMDLIAKKNLREFIKRINKTEKITIILTSHDLEDIEQLCPRVIVINHGKILYDGSMEAIKKKVHYKILDISFDEIPDRLPSIEHTRILESEQFRVKLQIDKNRVPIKVVLDTYLRSCKIADVVIEDPPIEDVIERLYRT